MSYSDIITAYPNYLSGSSVEINSQSITNTVYKTKIRGFELISINQFIKNIGDLIKKDQEVEVTLPKRATKRSAGYDIFAPFDFTLKPNEEIKIPTGLRSYMKENEYLKIVPRSGLGFKYYCRLANTEAIIDSDYYNSDNEGHIFIKIRNEGSKEMIIKKGEAFCQGIFQSYLLADGDDFNQGEDRNGGIGSTTR